MVTETTKTIVEFETKRIMETNPLVVQTQTGGLTQKALLTYLQNLEYLILQTPIHLERARTRALDLGLLEVATFMEEKIKEEQGHEEWVRNDLRSFNAPTVNLEKLDTIVPALKDLIAFTRSVIQQDPRLYLAHMLFAEYLTVAGGPTFLKLMEAHYGISSEQLTVIAYHEEADRKHVVDDFNILSSTIENSGIEDLFLNTLKQFIELIDRMLAECAEA